MGRHTEYRARHRAAGLCILCPTPVSPYSRYCPYHLERVRETDRKRIAVKRKAISGEAKCHRCGTKLDSITDGNRVLCLNCREQTSRRNRI